MHPISRRRFLELAGTASAALAAARCLPKPVAKHPYVESADLPTLGGAPDTADGLTIAAFVDTVVPGRHRDPLATVGGIDVGAPAKFFVPGSQIQSLVPLLVLALDAFAQQEAKLPFAALTPAQRDTALAAAIAGVPEIMFAVQLAKVSYYSAADTAALLGYPGPNTGYLADDNFSFRRPMAQPLALVVQNGGNLP